MKIFKELKKLGYKHYTEHTIEELDNLPSNSEERIMEQALVLRWFREKYNLYSIVFYHTDNKLVFEHPHYFRIYEMKYKGKQIEHSKEYKTYEDAELECIKKLIEIIKEKK